MSVQLTTTPGVVVAADTAVDAATLNLLGTPKVVIPAGSITGDELDVTSVAGVLGDLFRGQNLLPFGNMWPEQFLVPGGVSATAAMKTENMYGFYAEPSGAAVDYQRAEVAPDQKSGWSARLVGAGSVTEVRAGTYVGPDMCGQTRGATLTLSLYLYNGTGVVFTPSLEISTSNSVGDRGSVTLQSTEASAQTAPAGEWVRHSWQIDGSSVSNWKYGAELKLLLASGSLDSALKSVDTTQWQLEVGPVAGDFIRPVPYAVEVEAGKRFFLLDEDTEVGWDLEPATAAVAETEVQPLALTLARPAEVPATATHLQVEVRLDVDGSGIVAEYELNVGNSAVAAAKNAGLVEAPEGQIYVTVVRAMDGSGNVTVTVDRASYTSGTGTVNVDLKAKVVGYFV